MSFKKMTSATFAFLSTLVLFAVPAFAEGADAAAAESVFIYIYIAGSFASLGISMKVIIELPRRGVLDDESNWMAFFIGGIYLFIFPLFSWAGVSYILFSMLLSIEEKANYHIKQLELNER